MWVIVHVTVHKPRKTVTRARRVRESRTHTKHTRRPRAHRGATNGSRNEKNVEWPDDDASFVPVLSESFVRRDAMYGWSVVVVRSVARVVRCLQGT